MPDSFYCLPAEEIKTLSLSPAPNMTRAELQHVATVPNPKAVLVLCPGFNGSGENLIRSPKWIAFAKKNRLGLVGLSFASPIPALHDGTGYYYASKGSGEKLVEGIRKIYGQDLPFMGFPVGLISQAGLRNGTLPAFFLGARIRRDGGMNRNKIPFRLLASWRVAMKIRATAPPSSISSRGGRRGNLGNG